MQNQELKGVAINPYSHLHYIDHLAPICEIMNIPFLLMDHACIQAARLYYPELNIQDLEFQDFDPELLVKEYDVLFYSDVWNRDIFRQKFAPLEAKYQKKIRGVHCPHGYSDKSFYIKRAALEEITLVYGPNMLDMFKSEQVWDYLIGYVVTGNIRYTYYKKHQSFFDGIVEKEILSKFPEQKPLILYAPTWKDSEDSPSFFDAADKILGNLPADYNILVKLHPLSVQYEPVEFYRLLGKYEKLPHIQFIHEFPLIYPILDKTDIYIGDTSSIGYDFLRYNRPMFFLNSAGWDFNSDRRAFLMQVGVSISPENYSNIAKILQKALPVDKKYTFIRKEIDTYTFAPERAFADIKQDIIRVYNS